MTVERPKARGNAAERILAAAAECVSALGAAQVSMQAVADGAGVSKALIHYHFRDRDELLARLVDWLTVELVRGEEVALDGAAPQAGLDALWAWLDDALESGRLRALVELGLERGTPVRLAVRRSRETESRVTHSVSRARSVSLS